MEEHLKTEAVSFNGTAVKRVDMDIGDILKNQRSKGKWRAAGKVDENGKIKGSAWGDDG